MSRRAYARTSAPLWVSQNFLTRAATISRLIAKTSINKDDHVIEIGPGKGHITAALLRRCGRVTAVELDEKLCRALRDKFEGEAALRLVHADFLNWQLPARGPYKAFSNIPFCVTTAIVRKLTQCSNPPQEAWLVMEKGAAMRFIGQPRQTRESLLLWPRFDMDICCRLNADDFHPAPRVQAVMLHLARKPAPDVPARHWRAYEAFVRLGVSGGRRGLEGIFPRGRLRAALAQSGISLDFTPGQISYIQWLCLFRCLHRFERGAR